MGYGEDTSCVHGELELVWNYFNTLISGFMLVLGESVLTDNLVYSDAVILFQFIQSYPQRVLGWHMISYDVT